MNEIFTINSSIQSGATIKMNLFYRDSSVATPVLKDLIYVDCSIYNIYLYDTSDHTSGNFRLPSSHNYYNEVLLKKQYAPTISNTNILQVPSINFNSINLPAPTTVNGKTYYGLNSLYIRYMYKYNIDTTNSKDFGFTMYININNKV